MGWTQLKQDKQLAEQIQQAVTAYLLSPEQAMTEDFLDSDGQEETEEEEDDVQRHPRNLPFVSKDAEHTVMPHPEDPVAPIEATSDEAGKRRYARTRQIMIGKARPEYLRYREQVPFECRDWAVLGTATCEQQLCFAVFLDVLRVSTSHTNMF